MANWKNEHRADTARIKSRIREIGQAEVARLAGVTEMKVSRFVRGKHAGSASDFYRLAAAVSLSVVLVPAGSVVRVDGELFAAAGT
jgi:transcriptional regulator with XRE-family HTH domain